VWVGDAFVYRSSPSSWNESLDRVRSATLRELTTEEAHALRRLDGPIVAVLSVDDQQIEVAAAGSQKDALLGPFAAGRREKG
jgi:hypothetical protein